MLDIVPVDYVAAASAHLAFDEQARGSTVHLCAGPRGSATIEQVADRAAEFFHGPRPALRRSEDFLLPPSARCCSLHCGDASAAY